MNGTCDDGLVKYKSLSLEFITMPCPAEGLPNDFFVDIVSSSNFLSSCLNSLFSNVKNSEEVDSKLKEKANKFEANVTKRFGWDFTSELCEDAPIVVETSDE